jgi:protein-L-isoaspartate(D-aspartate) O-methyltransferase
VARILQRRLVVALIASALCVGPPIASAQSPDAVQAQRRRMVEQQILQRGISTPDVLDAMRQVPRHRFVDRGYADLAYEDRALPIGEAQTIPQPYLVALMASLLELDGDERVLEIGTGSGYQAAILAVLADEVYSMEILAELAERASRTLAELGYDNVDVVIGHGHRGLPDLAPFDGILVTAAPSKIPPPLLDQLAVGGKMVVAVGDYFQDLLVLTRTADGIEEARVDLVRLEPMTGEAQGDQP